MHTDISAYAFYELKDVLEIYFFNENEPGRFKREHSSMIIDFNKFKKYDCYPQELLVFDNQKHCVMQLIDTVLYNKRIIYDTYTYFPVLKWHSTCDVMPR
jgi:hypothetical protein